MPSSCSLLPVFYDNHGRSRKASSAPTLLDFLKSTLFRKILVITITIIVILKLVFGPLYSPDIASQESTPLKEFQTKASENRTDSKQSDHIVQSRQPDHVISQPIPLDPLLVQRSSLDSHSKPLDKLMGYQFKALDEAHPKLSDSLSNVLLASRSPDIVISTDVANKKIAIVTFYTKDQDVQTLKSITFPNFKKYASLHGYALIDALELPFLLLLYNDFIKNGGDPHCFKFFALQAILPSYDWVLWADGDSIFLNMTIPITRYTDSDYDAVFTVNPENDPVWSLINNSGHFLLKNSEWTKSFLEEAIEMSKNPCQHYLSMVPDKKPPIINSWINLCQEDGKFWCSDQGIIQWLMMFKPKTYTCHIQVRGFRDINSEYPWFGDGDFILHFPGKSPADRSRLIPLAIARANFTTGTFNRTGLNGELDPVENPRNAPNMYNQYYAHLNQPCSSNSSYLNFLASMFK